jgi:hypothetical protein
MTIYLISIYSSARCLHAHETTDSITTWLQSLHDDGYTVELRDNGWYASNGVLRVEIVTR